MVSDMDTIAADSGRGTPSLSRRQAREEAEGWLDWLVEHGEHNWKRTSVTGLRSQPIPELPCRILAATTEVTGGGHLPFLMLMAGRKRNNRYWQYTTQDLETGVPHPREQALSDISALVETLTRLADIPHKYPTRRIVGTTA